MAKDRDPSYKDLTAAYKSMYQTMRLVRDNLRHNPDESVTWEGSTNDLDAMDDLLGIVHRSDAFAELVYPGILRELAEEN